MLPKKRPPTHPSEMLLKEFLEPLGVSQKAFAAYLGPVARVAQPSKSAAAEESGMIATGMPDRLFIQGE